MKFFEESLLIYFFGGDTVKCERDELMYQIAKPKGKYFCSQTLFIQYSFKIFSNQSTFLTTAQQFITY